MALKSITVVLFTVFFSKALTQMCFNCSGLSPATCSQTVNCSSSGCSSMTTYNGINTTDVKQCANPSSCRNASINFGLAWMSSKCCSSDLCNNVTDLVDSLKCHICDANGIMCSKTQTQCKVGESQCITATVGSGTTIYTLKGCASANMCNSILLNSTLYSLKSTLPTSPLFSDLTMLSYSCCGSDLCNNMTRGTVSAGSSTFPPIFHLRPDLGGFLLILLVFGCSVL